MAQVQPSTSTPVDPNKKWKYHSSPTIEDLFEDESQIIVTAEAFSNLLEEGGFPPGDPYEKYLPQIKDGMAPFAGMAVAWLLVTVLIPVLLTNEVITFNYSVEAGYGFLFLGLFYLFGISSVRGLIWNGVLFMP